MSHRAYLFVPILLIGLLAAAPASARAQTLDHSMRAECVGGSLGCSQVDFFLELLSPGATATLDFLTLSILGPGWSFLSFAEAEDSFGPLVVNSVGSGFVMRADFDPFAVEMAPDLRLRAEMATYGTDAASLAFEYEGGTFSDPSLVRGTVATVTPEPLGMLLLGTGLAGIAVARRRKRGEWSAVMGE